MKWLATALLATFLIAGASAQEAAFYDVGGIEYYYAAGAFGSGQINTGFDPNGGADFEGCSWAKLRPDLNVGRAQALGVFQNQPILIDFNEFERNGTPDAVGPGEVSYAGANVPVLMGATAAPSIRINGVNLQDPVTGADSFVGSWFVSQGFRDDAGALQTLGDGPFQPGDSLRFDQALEMHVHVTSPQGLKQSNAYWQVDEPSGTPTWLPPEDTHYRFHAIPNERFTGNATISVAASSLAPAGANNLRVSVIAPDATVVHQFAVDPALGASVSVSRDFPLDLLGSYFVALEGPVNLISYTVQVEQRTPDTFELDLWWEDVQPGYAGLEARTACDEALDGGVGGGVLARPPPVPFAWASALFTVGAGVTVVLVGTAITLGARAAIAARRVVQS